MKFQRIEWSGEEALKNIDASASPARLNSFQFLQLRKNILYPKYTLQEALYPEDHEKEAIHYAAFDGKEIVAVASVFRSYIIPASKASQASYHSHSSGFSSKSEHVNDGQMGEEVSRSIEDECGASPVCYRLRGMAVKKDLQTKGVGGDLLDFILEDLQEEGAQALWCKARQSSLGFYQKMGFQMIGKEYNVPGIGPHTTGWIQL